MTEAEFECLNCGQASSSLDVVMADGNCPRCGSTPRFSSIDKKPKIQESKSKVLLLQGVHPVEDRLAQHLQLQGLPERPRFAPKLSEKEPEEPQSQREQTFQPALEEPAVPPQQEQAYHPPLAASTGSGSSNPEDVISLQIVPVKGIKREMDSIVQLINSLASTASPITLEFSGKNLRRFIIVRCKRQHVEMVKAQLTGIYGSPEIIEVSGENDPGTIISDGYEFRAHTRLSLIRSEALPIRTYRELTGNDSVIHLLSTLYGLKENEAAVIQIVVHGKANPDWTSKYRKELLEIRRRKTGQLSMRDYLRIFALIIGFLGGGAYFLIGSWWSLIWLLGISLGFLYLGAPLLLNQSDLEWSESLEEMVLRKIEQPGYETEIRLAAAGSNKSRVQSLLETMIGSFRVFTLESGNSLEPTGRSTGFRHNEMKPQSDATFILGDTELATLWHLPLETMPDMMEIKKFDHRMVDPTRFNAGSEGWEIGYSSKSAGEDIPISLPLQTISDQHAILLGQSRMGKSTALEHMVQKVMEDPTRSIVVLDPHSDMIDRLIGLVPPGRVGDVLYLNFADDTLLPGFNPLDITLYGGDPEKTAASFIEVAHTLYGKYWGPRMEVPLARVMMALVLANTIRTPETQFTILDAISVILMNNDKRQSFLEKMMPEDHPMTKVVLRYFQIEFNTRTKSFIEQIISPVLSKLRPFESNSYLLGTFGQPVSTFNPIQAVRDRKIIFVQTGTAQISSEFANFIGSIILNMVKIAILDQANIAPEDRSRVTIVVDESQLLPGVDFGKDLAMMLKFGGNYFLTSQGASFLGRATASDQQDRPMAFQQIMSNVATKIIFRLSGYDANIITDTEFSGEMEPSNLYNLPAYQAFLQFSANGEVHGPMLVKMNPPSEYNKNVADSILALRTNYCLPFAEAVSIGAQVSDRIVEYHHSEAASDDALQDGEGYIHQTAKESERNVPTPHPKVVQVLKEKLGIGLDKLQAGTPKEIEQPQKRSHFDPGKNMGSLLKDLNTGD